MIVLEIQTSGEVLVNGQSQDRCPHLAAPVTYRSGPQQGDPVTVEVTCDTCGGKRKQVAQPVFSCELFRRCLPYYRPTDAQRAEYASRPDAIRLCDGCDRVVD